jgi:hypothetical protein
VSDFVRYGGLQFRGSQQIQSYVRNKQHRPLVQANKGERPGGRLVYRKFINRLPLVQPKHDAKGIELLPLRLFQLRDSTLLRQRL